MVDAGDKVARRELRSVALVTGAADATGLIVAQLAGNDFEHRCELCCRFGEDRKAVDALYRPYVTVTAKP